MSEKQAKQIAGPSANASGCIVEITDDHETLFIAFVPVIASAEHHDHDCNGHGHDRRHHHHDGDHQQQRDQTTTAMATTS